MENLKTLDNINLQCEIHKSPIGGVCSDYACTSNPLLCIFCATDEHSCIRRFNHEIITFEEYFMNYDKVLMDKVVSGLTKEALINNVIKLDIEDVRLDHLKSLDRKEKAFTGHISEIKDKLVATFAKEVGDRLSMNDKALTEIKMTEDFLASLGGFDLIGRDITKRLEKIKSSYSEFNNIEIPGIDTLPAVNEVNDSDFIFVNKLVHLLKTLQGNKLLKEQFQNILKQQELLDKYENQTNTLSNFSTFLFDLEMIVPNMITNYMQDESKLNIEVLRKYVGVLHDNVFSYSKPELFNTCKKQDFCTTDPKLLKYNLTITNKFQTKNTLPEMVNVFKTFDQNKYLIFSSDKSGLYYINYSEGFKTDMPLKTIEGNKGIVYKIEHYYSELTTTDYIVSITSEKILFIFIYIPSTQSFKLYKSLTFNAVCYSFDIIELFDKPYIITAILKDEVKMYNFHDLTLAKTMEKINSHVYSIKSFYNKKLNQYILVVMTGDSIVLINIETGVKIKSLLNPNKKNWFLHGIVIETDKDYLIVANMQNDLGVFSFETGKLLMIIGSKTTAYRGIEVWNEKYLIAANDNKEIDIYEINTGVLVHNLKSHTKHICGCRRVKEKEEMLISFSMDGTLMLYTC
jgi:hypothetical protein